MIKVYLTNSNPNGIIQGNLGDMFYRNRNSFYIINSSNVMKPVPIVKKAFAFQLFKSSANQYKEDEIAFKTEREVWIKKTKTRDNRQGWTFVKNATPLAEMMATATPTPTPTPTPTSTPTASPTATPTSTTTPTASPTPTSSRTPTRTGTSSSSNTSSSSSSGSSSNSASSTSSSSTTSSNTPTPSTTPTLTSTPTPTSSPTPTSTGTPTPTTTPTPTPTGTPTSTGTPTITSTPTSTSTAETPYYLLLSRCDAEPNTVTGWTLNTYTQSQIMVGDIFYSAGGYYYQVINYQTQQPNPAGTLDGSKSNDYTSCDQTPGHWVAPPPIVGHALLIYTGETYASSTSACNDVVYQSDAGTSGTTWYLSGHTIPANGDYLYTSEYCLPLETAVGNSNYYIAFSGGTKYVMTIGSSGYINNVTTCGATPTSTPTSTSTSTPTSTSYYQVDILQGVPGDCSNTSSACYDFNTNGTPGNTTIYTASGTLLDGETAYNGPLGPGDGIFDGNMYYYTNGSSYVRITNFGIISVVGNCTDSGPCN